jgi:hypothetical protein
MKRQTKKAIAGLSVHGLTKFKDSEGRRLHPKAIKGEIARRVRRNKVEHPAVAESAAQSAPREGDGPLER